MSLPGGEDGSRAQLGMQLMKSRAFIGDFVERHDILPELMAVKAWDAGSGQIIFDPESYDAATKIWVREVDAKSPLLRLKRRIKHFPRSVFRRINRQDT